MSKSTTWSARLSEEDKVALETRLEELLELQPDSDRVELILLGLDSLSDEAFIEASNQTDALNRSFAVIEQVRETLKGFAAIADNAEKVAADKYLKRIESLEEQAKAATADAKQAKEQAQSQAEIAANATKNLEATESALKDKTALTENLAAQIIDLEQSRDAAKALSSDSQKQASEATKKATTLELKVSELITSVSVLEAEKAAAIEAKEDLKLHIADLQKQIASIKTA